jgi:3-dehydroquinate synthase
LQPLRYDETNVPVIQVQSSSGKYPVSIGSGLLRTVGKHPLVAGRTAFVVTTPRVLGLHGEKLLRGFPSRSKPAVLLVPEGEQQKRLRTVERLASELAQADAHRDALLLGLGGGVIGDITGFLAAIYQRGVDVIQIPTTVLAQVDASVGGKTGVNLPEGKNLIGSFYPPKAVVADVDTLQTLSDREYRAGLFESIKCGILRDAKLFSLMERKHEAILQRDADVLENVIAASVRVKAGIVSRDEHEAGERMLLNFGHTFGHALESALKYKTLLHGEAVAWGMLAALDLSMTLGSLQPEDADRAAALIEAYGPLPRFKLTVDDVLAATARDKKHTQTSQRYILANAIGDAFVAQGVPLEDVRGSVEFLLQYAGGAR